MREQSLARRYKLKNLDDLCGLLANDLDPIHIVSEAPVY